MTKPVILDLSPSSGPSSGGDVVWLRGTGFAENVAVLIGGVAAEVLRRFQIRTNHGDEDGQDSADGSDGQLCLAARTPRHAPGTADLVLRNVDGNGVSIPGEETSLPAAYQFARPPIAGEADLTRLVRALLRELKRQVIENVSMAVALDYDDTPADGLSIVAVAKLPALVLSGPRIAENRFYSSNVLAGDVAGSSAGEVVRRRPPFTVDLGFTITGTSDRTVELLNLLAATARFLNRNRWLELDRDPDCPAKGTVRWEMDPDGDIRTKLDGEGEVRVFTCGLLVRGFDIDEGLPADIGQAVTETSLDVGAIAPGGNP
ncbi:MAG: IPT/TIG domain-containing protein [Pseudomonadota bacterium]